MYFKSFRSNFEIMRGSRFILLIAFFLFQSSFSNAGNKLPNIVIIVADDLGYGDVGFHGSDIKTPNLDRLAREGAQLEQFYSCPMCSPTRAGLMTGRYPIRFGMMRSVVPPRREYGLPVEEETIAEMIAKAGYKHRAIVGKWHIGHRKQKWLPQNQGFTYSEGCYNGAIDYFSLERDGIPDWHKNDKPMTKNGYATDLIGQSAIEFIESVPADEPFFLYVPFNAPHSPFQAKTEDIANYPNREGKKRIYAAMVDCMDQNIGEIISCLEKRAQLDNTFILFFSDNGGVSNVASNGPLKGAKLTPYQGGIRVAAAARWPDGGISGGVTINEIMGYIDVFPTVMDIAQYKGKPQNKLDGISVLKSLQGKTMKDRHWFTYLDQSPAKTEKIAVLNKQWKLVVHRGAPDSLSIQPNYELFSINEDPNEINNLANHYPQEIESMMKEFEKFYSFKIEDQIPRFGNKKHKSGEPIPYWQPLN